MVAFEHAGRNKRLSSRADAQTGLIVRVLGFEHGTEIEYEYKVRGW
jgi:hypothetical protein